LVIILVAAGLMFAYFTAKKSGMIDKAAEVMAPKGKQAAVEVPKEVRQVAKDAGMPELTVALNVWGGNISGIFYNGGAVPAASSRYLKDGVLVKIVITDEIKAMRDGWKSGQYDIMGLTTLDALPTEIESLKEFEPIAIMAIDKSFGGDVVVVAPGIKSPRDLMAKGEKIAFAGLSPSQSLGMVWFEADGIKYSDMKKKNLLVETDSAPAAASQFKAGAVKAAIMWSPDDNECIKAIPGAKKAFDTRKASEAIVDVLLVKKSVLNKKKDAVIKFVRGWLMATKEINTDPKAKEEAGKLIMATMGISKLEEAIEMIDNAKLMTYGDNLHFFGIKTTPGAGITGEEMWTKMCRLYYEAGVAPKDAPPFRKLVDLSILNAIQLSGAGHEPENAPKFAAPTEALKTAPVFAQKPAPVQFAFNSAELTEEGKVAIDTYFANTAKEFRETRVRIEGNTDNVGSAAYNVKLSNARARSVAVYLAAKYGFDPNRFVIRGHGFDNPVPGCEKNATEECRAKNRRTEFALIQ
jgi:NitT/TauT family transport system substrate-binding protein